jgi:hypothetical protein
MEIIKKAPEGLVTVLLEERQVSMVVNFKDC